MMSGRTPAASSAWITPMCANPLAPPPLRTSAVGAGAQAGAWAGREQNGSARHPRTVNLIVGTYSEAGVGCGACPEQKSEGSWVVGRGSWVGHGLARSGARSYSLVDQTLGRLGRWRTSLPKLASGSRTGRVS